MKTPTWDSGFARHNVHGLARQRALIELAVADIGKRELAIDVGAHIGLTTIPLAQMFYEVHAFEPVIENFECLEENTKTLTNVKRYHQALTARYGDTFVMQMPPAGNSGCWRLAHNQYAPYTTRTLDSYGLIRVSFIKLDVEGCEGFVLQGAIDTLLEDRPLVLFEDNGLGPQYYDEWVDPKEVLASVGYRREARFGKNELWRA